MTDSTTTKPPENSFVAWLRYRLQRRSIDRELANGADPESNPYRHRRAYELTAESERSKLAGSIDRLLARSEAPQSLTIAPINWRGVRASSSRLKRLAQRLRGAADVRPQGVARTEILLKEADSPLYTPGGELSLPDEVRSTLALL
jgi:hypothetical protein